MFTAEDDARIGVKVERRPYPSGEDGIRMSLAAIAKKTREGAATAAMKSFTGNVLKQAGFPKSCMDKARALLDYVRANVGYVPDAPGHEVVAAPALTLCVDGAPICLRIGDCDDLTCALACLTMCAGLVTEIVRVFYGENIQQHVFVEVQDERGDWIPLDPSTGLPAGKKTRGKWETRISPLDDKAIGLEGTDRAGAQYIGIGRPLEVWEQDVAHGGTWHKHDPNKGLGADPTSTVPYKEITDGMFHTGLRYRIGMQVSAQQAWQLDRQTLKNGFASDFQIESLEPAGEMQQASGDYPYFQSWILQGVALREGSFPSDAERFFKYGVTGIAGVTLKIKRLVMGVQASATTPPAPPKPTPRPPGVEDETTIGVVGAIGIAAGLAVVGGVGWHYGRLWWQKRKAEKLMTTGVAA